MDQLGASTNSVGPLRWSVIVALVVTMKTVATATQDTLVLEGIVKRFGSATARLRHEDINPERLVALVTGAEEDE